MLKHRRLHRWTEAAESICVLPKDSIFLALSWVAMHSVREVWSKHPSSSVFRRRPSHVYTDSLASASWRHLCASLSKALRVCVCVAAASRRTPALLQRMSERQINNKSKTLGEETTSVRTQARARAERETPKQHMGAGAAHRTHTHICVCTPRPEKKGLRSARGRRDRSEGGGARMRGRKAHMRLFPRCK